MRLDESAEQPRHVGDLLVAHLLAFGAEALAHLPPEARCVDELHLALAMRGLAVGDDPDVGRDAGVVEHVGRQADDRLDQIVLQHVAPDFALARPRAAGEERRAVEHDAEAAAAVRRRAHLRDEMHEEQHRAVRHARQAGPEAAVEAVASRAPCGLPFRPSSIRRRTADWRACSRTCACGWPSSESVLPKTMLRDVLPLDEHVRLADGVGLGVQFLPEHGEPRLRVHRGQVLVRDGQHAAGAGRRIVDRAHDARLGQNLVVLDEDEVDHQADDLARREVLAGRLVGEFGELADQLLEDEAHLGVVDDVGVEVDGGEFLGDQIEQVGLGEPVDLDGELEALENVADVGREALHIGRQVLAHVVLVADELLQVEGGRVVEALPGLAQEERLRVEPGLLLVRQLRQHRRLGRLQHAIETAQHGEGQNDLAVVRLLVVAAQKVGDRPDEGRKRLVVQEMPPAKQVGASPTAKSVSHFSDSRDSGKGLCEFTRAELAEFHPRRPRRAMFSAAARRDRQEARSPRARRRPQAGR